jgi:hypothetical protein
MNHCFGLARCSSAISTLARGVLRSQSAMLLATCLAMLTLTSRVAPAQGQATEIVVNFSATPTGTAKPWLVVFLFDRSTSMLEKYTAAAIPGAKVDSRWDAVLEIASRRLADYQRSLGSFEFVVYDFDTDAADWRRPRDQKRLINSPASADAAARSLRFLPKPNGATNLWSSVRNIFDGAQQDNIARNYAGLSLVVLSDGEDGVPGDASRDSPNRYRSAIAAMNRFKDPLSIDFVAFANLPTSFVTDVKGIGTLSNPNTPVALPTVESLGISPSSITVSELPGKGAECPLAVRIDGTPLTAEQIRTAKFSLRPNQLGVKLEHDQDLRTFKLVRQSDSVLGGPLVLDCEIARADAKAGTQPLQASCQIVVPASKALPAITDWGLPSPCNADNRRVVLLMVGEPLELSVGAIPAAASCSWTVDGQVRSTDRSLSLPNLTPGSHPITVQASLRNDVRTVELVAVVIDPTLNITMPQRVEAGSVAEFSASPALPIPDELVGSLSDFEWTATSTQPVTGRTLTATYANSGPARVRVVQELTHCGRTVLLQGTTAFTVARGPSLRLLPGGLTRGIASMLGAQVDQADRISSVLFTITDPNSGTLIDSQSRAVTRDPIDPLAGSAEVSIEYSGAATTLRVTATPILVDDSGKSRDAADPECVRRIQTADISVRSPEVTLHVEPAPGSEISFGEQFEIIVRPEGAHSSAVDRVEITLTSASPRQVAFVNAQSGWKLPLRAVAGMGSTLTIDAKALDADGREVLLAKPFDPPALKLIPAVPELKVTSSLGSDGDVEWTGPNSEPPLLSARLVIKGGDSAYPLAEQLASVTWSCSDGIQLVNSGSSGLGTDRATFQILRAGIHRIEAKVSNVAGPLATTITARPVDVAPGPELAEKQFESDDPVAISHANTRGAWKEAVVRIRTDGVNWIPLASDNILDPTPASDVAAEYEVWYRPWGVPASSEPWTPGSGWVVSKPMGAHLLKPRNWPIFWLFALIGAGAICGLFLLSKGHRHRWSVIEWNRSPHGVPEDRVRGFCGTLPTFRRAKYRFLRKVVELELPDVPNEDEYRWTSLARGGRGSACKAFIEWHNDGYHFVINGQLEDGSLRGGSHKAVGATGAGNFQLCVSYPRSLQGSRDLEWKPLYLRIHEHKGTTARNLVQHWLLIFVFGSLIVSGAFTYLALVRVI